MHLNGRVVAILLTKSKLSLVTLRIYIYIYIYVYIHSNSIKESSKFNPVTPKSVQYLISPYNITLESNI